MEQQLKDRPQEVGLKVKLSPQGELHCLVRGEVSPEASEAVQAAIHSSDYRAGLSVRLELEFRRQAEITRRQAEITRVALYGVCALLGLTIASSAYFPPAPTPTQYQGELNNAR